MSPRQLEQLGNRKLAAYFEVLRESDGPPTAERIAVEEELARRVKLAGILDVGGIRYLWNDEDDSFCRERNRGGRQASPEGGTARAGGR